MIRARRASFAVVALAVLFALTAPAHAADIGKPAPDVALTANDGTALKLSLLRGKVVYLDFWASWCIPCRQSFPWMGELQARHAKDDFVVLAVNLDAQRGDADAFLARYPAKFKVAFDASGASARQFGVKAMPTSYVIGRDGTLLNEHRGFRDDQTTVVEAEIGVALAKK